MEVRIRLQRIGKSSKKRYNYRIVAISREKGRDSRHLEILGHYDPTIEPESLKFHEDKLEKWLKEGAGMTETVKGLLKRYKKRQSTATAA